MGCALPEAVQLPAGRECWDLNSFTLSLRCGCELRQRSACLQEGLEAGENLCPALLKAFVNWPIRVVVDDCELADIAFWFDLIGDDRTILLGCLVPLGTEGGDELARGIDL